MYTNPHKTHMPTISMIAALSEINHAIGKNNMLLWHIPEDLTRFKTITSGHPIIMGRKTHESIGKSLPGRLNIMLSKHTVDIQDVTVVKSLQDSLKLTIGMPEVMIIGGADVFQQALPLADQVYLTIIHAQLDADVFFPELDKKTWHCKETIERARDEKNSYDLTFCRFERNQ